MKFTYDGYTELIELIRKEDYLIADYNNWKQCEKCVILRHDVDTDLQKALELATLEYRMDIKSTYFVLITSNFYNPNSNRNRTIMKEIQNMGHTVGLHFDEMAYPDDIGRVEEITVHIQNELKMLSDILQMDVYIFSYHRPTRRILDADIRIQGAINSYSDIFFKQFKYLSDSRMYWREPALDIICGRLYQRLHILTHPFWYQERKTDMKEIIENFIKAACIERYKDLDDNLTNLDGIIGGIRL